MKILALEFSTDHRSVAVLESGTGVVPALLGVASEIGARSSRAFALIEQALSAAKLEREQVECVALGLGPGSYTGIRVALSVAQGWQLGRGVKLLGVSSVECLAAQAHAAGCRGRTHIVVDAQRNELYLAGYDLTVDGWREVEPLRLATLAEAQALAARGGVFLGPDVKRWFAEGRELFPAAATLARLAATRTDFVAGEKLEPIYLRETSFVKAPPPRIIS